ncbi:hypothetical protein COHA_007978 [Chlorella ohadii]|uniref:J domain-containing protein n=1 Tax=Chlorella ohadii TaxID=2649997 RepID=A0AAD5DL73_9CHLO|nr:hypothetical protein COHA_007978 [Chlorella ohadii]
MDPYAVLGLQPGATKVEIKKAFRQKAMAHHPDMHSTASEHVRAANDKAFKALNEAYQSLMDGSYRSRPQSRAGAYGRGPYSAYTGSYGSSYGAAGGRAGGGFDPNYNPFQSYYRQGTGGSYWGWKQYARRGGSGLDFASVLRSFAGLGRTHAAAMAALGLLIAGGLLLAEPLTSSLWASHNEGKLFSAIEAEAAAKKQRKAAEAAAALQAARAAMAAAQQQQQQQQQEQQQQQQQAVAGPAVVQAGGTVDAVQQPSAARTAGAKQEHHQYHQQQQEQGSAAAEPLASVGSSSSLTATATDGLPAAAAPLDRAHFAAASDVPAA